MNNINQNLSEKSEKEFADLLDNARHIERESAIKNASMDVFWPCGFAWITFKMRKNHKHAKALINDGAYWDDYSRAYKYRCHATSSQNMDYKQAILNDVARYFQDNGIPVYVETRID